MNICVVIPAKLLLLFRRKASDRLLHIALGVFGADHEADLARRIGGDGRVGVFHGWEDFFTVLLELRD